MRRRSRMYTCVTLGFGCDEDSSLSIVPLIADTGFSTPEDALRDLAMRIYKKYKLDCVPKRNMCCLFVDKVDPTFKFCPQCGTILDSLMDFGEYSIWLSHIPTYTVDSWKPSTALDNWSLPIPIWDVIKAGAGSIVSVPDRAEYCLIAALAPQSVDEEDKEELIRYQEENNLDVDNLSYFIDNMDS